MQSVMFDIDGTLVQSFEFDEICYTQAVREVLGFDINPDWASYKNVTDTGLLMELLERIGDPMSIQELEAEVKPLFVQKVEAYLERNGLQPIPGALEFVQTLAAREDIALSFATGGWLKTAKMKLAAAGFSVNPASIFSSNDHFKRTEIMKKALVYGGREGGIEQLPRPLYFGDAEWDKAACEELGFQFVLVGKRTTHQPSIDDFTDYRTLKELKLDQPSTHF